MLKISFNETGSSTIVICIICASVCCCHAGDHPCTIDYQLEIDMTARTHQDERLVADLTDSNQTRCSWLFKVPALSGRRALVLEGLSNSKPSGSQLRFELHDPTGGCPDAGARTNVTPGLFCVLPLTNRRTYLSVTLNRRPEELVGPKPTVLRAVTPADGICSRDMLGFNGSCYAISPVKEKFSDSMRNIMGQAQLASFESAAEIRKLIAANDDRLKIYPFKRPLNLTQRVRVGILQKEADKSMLSIVRNESGCGLKCIPGPTDILPTTEGKCGFLELSESGQPVIKFGNCDELLPALVSFPESDLNHCKDCSFNHDHHVEALLYSLSSNDKEESDFLFKKMGMGPIVTACVAAVLTVSVVAATVAGVKILLKKKQSGDISKSTSTCGSAKSCRTTEFSSRCACNNSSPSESLLTSETSSSISAKKQSDFSLEV